ncbi:MAG: hypothetical protein ACTSRP_09930 [Candidatus Helarchaeota archaeon]
MEIAEYEITIETPTIIISKKGTGNFYLSTDIIPSTTLQGAFARKAIIENSLSGLGNCSKIEDSNLLPNCDTCNIEECFYRKIWLKRELKICDAVIYHLNQSPNSNTIFDKAPPIMKLQSIFRDRKNEKILKDFLFYNYIFLKIIKNKNRQIFTKFFELNVGNYKKTPCNIGPKNGKINQFKKYEVPKTEFFHIAIDSKFKSTKLGALYSFIALNRNLKFRTIAIGTSNILKFIEGNYRIGTAKSRGYGNISIKMIKQFKIDEFLKLRTKNIQVELKKIKELLNLPNNLLIATFSGLSPLYSSKNFFSPQDLLISRLQININQLVNFHYKMGYSTFVQQTQKEFQIINIPSIQRGYCGVIEFYNSDTQELSEKLSKIEFDFNKIIDSSGWLYINHPIHYSLSII